MFKFIRKQIPFILIGVLMLSNTQAIFENRASYSAEDENIANIGEVFGVMGGFGFIDHNLFLHNKKVEWNGGNGIVNGTVEMNYSLFYLFGKKIPRFMATGFLVYLDGEKIGGNKIFTTNKKEKTYMGTLKTNVSFKSDGREYVTLKVMVWFMCFPSHPLDALFGNLSSHGLLNWLTLGTFDMKKVEINVEIEKTVTMNKNNAWIHTRYDIQNTGFTPAVGKGSILRYRMKNLFCKHLIGMGTGEPKVADIDNDGKPEIIFGTQTGYVYAIENGWRVDWKCKINAPDTYMSPELGDINGDGNYEVIVSSDNIFESNNSGLRIIDKDGNLIAEWKNPEGGFPLGEARAADINGDGKDEILVGLLGDDKRGNDLYALSYNDGGIKTLWKYQAYSWVQYPSAVADINNDGKSEIIFTSHDMCIYCLNSDGNLIWKYVTKGGLQPIYPGGFRRLLFNPTVYDVNDDGYKEIIVTACLYDKPNWSAVYCLDHNGKLIWKFEPGHSIFGPVAIGDLDNDGKVDMVFGDINGTIYALKNNGKLLWKKPLPKFYFKTGPLSGAPAKAEFCPYLADLDGDGHLEIIAVAWCHGLFVLNYQGKLLKQWPRPFGMFGYGGAAIADIDNDGDLEILVGIAGKMGIFGKIGIIDQ